MACRKKTDFGTCQQPTRGLCSYHRRMRDNPGFREDVFYHRKVVERRVSLTESYVTPVEMDALFRQKMKHDGRRLDAWSR